MDAIEQAARQPSFFEDPVNLPDEVSSRYNLVMLHLFLLTNRIAPENPKLAQQVHDRYFINLDRYLREVGVSDARMATRVHQMVERFYGFSATLHATLNDHSALSETISRNLFSQNEQTAASNQLAGYCQLSQQQLSSLPLAALPAAAQSASLFPVFDKEIGA